MLATEVLLNMKTSSVGKEAAAPRQTNWEGGSSLAQNNEYSRRDEPESPAKFALPLLIVYIQQHSKLSNFRFDSYNEDVYRNV